MNTHLLQKIESLQARMRSEGDMTRMRNELEYLEKVHEALKQSHDEHSYIALRTKERIEQLQNDIESYGCGLTQDELYDRWFKLVEDLWYECTKGAGYAAMDIYEMKLRMEREAFGGVPTWIKPWNDSFPVCKRQAFTVNGETHYVHGVIVEAVGVQAEPPNPNPHPDLPPKVYRPSEIEFIQPEVHP